MFFFNLIDKFQKERDRDRDRNRLRNTSLETGKAERKSRDERTEVRCMSNNRKPRKNIFMQRGSSCKFDMLEMRRIIGGQENK